MFFFYFSECQKNGNTWTCISVHDIGLSRGWLLINQPFYKTQDEKTIINANSSNEDSKDDQSKEDLSFLQILPQQDPEDKLHYLHLAMVSSGKVEFLSQGQMSVLAIHAWKDTKIYFEATNVNDPGSKHLYVADTVQKGNAILSKMNNYN
jgi:hypothetical protein